MSEVRDYLRRQVSREALERLCTGLLGEGPSLGEDAEDLLLEELGSGRTPPGLRELLPSEAEAMRILALADGELPRMVFVHLLQETMPAVDGESLLWDLGVRGLLFSDAESGQVFFPAPLLPLLRSLLPRRRNAGVPQGPPAAMGRMVARIANYVRNHPLRVKRGGGVHRTYLLRLEQFLRLPGMHANAHETLVGFLRHAGAFREADGFLIPDDRRCAELCLLPEEQLWAAWLHYTDVVEERPGAMAILESLVRAEGIADLDTLCIRALGVLVRSRGAGAAFPAEEIRALQGALRRDAAILEALGLVCGEGTPTVLHLMTPGAQPPGRLFLQQDNQILLPEPVEPAVEFEVGRMADLLEADTVTRYVLTRGSVTGLLEQDRDAENLIAFLERHAFGGVPQPVAAQLRAWADEHGDATFHAGVVVQLKDEALGQLCRELPETAKWIRSALAPAVFLLEPDGVEPFMAALEDAGFSPRRRIEAAWPEPAVEPAPGARMPLLPVPRPRLLRKGAFRGLPSPQVLGARHLVDAHGTDADIQWFRKTMGKWRDGLSLRKKSLVFRLCARLNYLADVEREDGATRQTLQPVRVTDGVEPELEAIVVGDGGATTVALRDIRRLKVLGNP